MTRLSNESDLGVCECMAAWLQGGQHALTVAIFPPVMQCDSKRCVLLQHDCLCVVSTFVTLY